MTYEITYILKPELTTEEQTAVNKTVENHIKALGGSMQSVERTFSVERGGTDENNLRKFAYPIKHYRQGYYYTMLFDIDGTNLPELDQTLSREAEILRFLVVKDFNPLAPVEAKTAEEAKAEQVLEEVEATEEKKPRRTRKSA